MNVVASRFGLSHTYSVSSAMVICLLLMGSPVSAGHAQDNEAAAQPSPLYVFRFIEVTPDNVAKWKQAVKTKQQQ